MAKLRHIALIVSDVEASARFYEQAFDLKRVEQEHRKRYRRTGIEAGGAGRQVRGGPLAVTSGE